MRRREFITFVGGAAVAWPLTGRAQSERVRKIGVLISNSEDDVRWSPLRFDRRLTRLAGRTVVTLISITDILPGMPSAQRPAYDRSGHRRTE
jgi:hypothetical protein